jgi:predicted dehydrogenase
VETVRIGFVGVGAMGQCAHLRNYVITPRCKVAAIAELRPQLAMGVALRYGVTGVYRDHREMLANEKLDALVAIQPYQIHGQIIPELLKTKLPILIEKPLARSIEVAEQIVATPGSERLYIGYHKRSDPATLWAVQQIKQWKSTGEMGAMKYVRVTMPPGDWIAQGFSQRIESDEPYPKLEFDPPPEGMGDAAAKQYDAFVNYYIHQVNLIRLLLGDEYHVAMAEPSGVLMIGHSEGGVVCALEMAPYRTTTDWQESAFVSFEKGWIKIELPAPLAIDRAGKVTLFEDDGGGPRTITPEFPRVHAMRRQAEQFVAAVRGERTNLCRVDEALKDLRVAKQYLDFM